MSAELEGFATIPRSLQRDPDVTWMEKLVYVALSSRANARNQCWPSIATIAKDASMSESSAKRALEALRDDRKVLSWRPDPNGKPGRTVNIYTLGAPVDTGEGGSHRPPPGSTQTPGGGHTDLLTIEGNESIEVGTPAPAKRQKKSSAATTFPEGWKPTPAHHDYGQKHGINVLLLAEKFEETTRAKGTTYVDWDRGFQTWLLNERDRIDRAAKGRQPHRGREPYNWAGEV